MTTKAGDFDVRSLIGVAEDTGQALGVIIWYTVPNDLVRDEILVGACKHAGIKPPNPINPADAFRRVSKGVEQKRLPYGDESEQKTLNILVRDVKNTDSYIYRQIVREVVDSQNRVLEYAPEVEVVYERASKSILINNIHKDESGRLLPLTEHVEAAVRTILNEFDREAHHYNGNHVRGVLRRAFTESSGIPLKDSGGLYFIPRQHMGIVRNLKDFAYYLRAEGYRLNLTDLPVIDSADRRDMVLDAMKERMRDQHISLMARISKTKKEMDEGRHIPPSVIAGFLKDVQDARKVTADFEELLETSLNEIKDTFSLLEEMVKQLMLDNPPPRTR